MGWHNVDSWVGPLDSSANGIVEHAVDPKDFGKGPFRWVLLDKQGGNVLGMSGSFYFPTFATTVGTTIDASTLGSGQ